MKLSFEKLANFERVNEYAKISIPFSEGELLEENKVSVKDKMGNALVTQREVVSRYKDGSIKWLLVHFLATLNANDKTDFEVVLEKSKEYEIIDVKKEFEFLPNLVLNYNVNGKNGLIKLNDFDKYSVIKNGPVFTELSYITEIIEDGNKQSIEIILTFYRDKKYAKIDVKSLNTSKIDMIINEFYLSYNSDINSTEKYIGYSNYRTKFIDGEGDLFHRIDAETLMQTSNEHFIESFFGAYFGVHKNSQKLVAITIKEAFQNYPKAIAVSDFGIKAFLVPVRDTLVLNQGVGKTHTLFVQYVEDATRDEINKRHLQFQMPDMATLESEIYKKVNLQENLFTSKKIDDIEAYLVKMADSKGSSFGDLHFGDVYDSNYTDQGRGSGHLVFTNNEYDYPYYAYLMYLRSGVRRFYDYFSAGIRHMIDVDICHYSENPLRQDGLIEHSANHSTGPVELSHMWLRGLICYYHETGDRYAKEAFINMGENILRNLNRPEIKDGYDYNVRETGWALFALTALYEETYEDKYLDAATEIVGHFIKWKENFGAFVAPYTDHTTIRVPFMIAVACNSLYSYYRITKDEKVKELILFSMDDLLENAMLDNGFFYYKELPSLQRVGNNVIILETLATCYSFTSDIKYLKAGLNTFNSEIKKDFKFPSKVCIDGVVLQKGDGTKHFAQAFYPVIKFYEFATITNLI